MAKVRYFAGTTLATEGNSLLTSPIAGIVSYKVDGLEIVDTQEQFAQLSIDKIERALTNLELNEANNVKDEIAKTNPNQIAAGDIAFKVTDNLAYCYLYFKTEETVESWFQADKRILLQAEDGGKGYGIMKESQVLTEGSGVLLQLSSGLEKQRLNRQVPIKVIVEKQDKAAVPASAIVTKDEIKGVYIFKDGYVNWSSVTVIEEGSGQVIVEGLSPEQWVVLRPWFVRDGMRLKIR